MAIRSSIPAGKITWTEEPGGVWFLGSQRVRQDRTTEHRRTQTTVRLHTQMLCFSIKSAMMSASSLLSVILEVSIISWSMVTALKMWIQSERPLLTGPSSAEVWKRLNFLAFPSLM